MYEYSLLYNPADQSTDFLVLNLYRSDPNYANIQMQELFVQHKTLNVVHCKNQIGVKRKTWC